MFMQVCEASTDACEAFGLGTTGDGVFLFFVGLALCLLGLVLAASLSYLWYSGHLPKFVVR
jgi:hypothetical protein